MDPCCGYDLHKAAKTVAVFDVILSIIELAAAMVFESGPVTVLSSDTSDPTKRDVNYVVSMTLLYGVCLVIMRIVQLCCSILLLYGVVEKHHKKCETWFIFSCVIVTLAFLQILYESFIREKIAVTSEPLALRVTIPSLELILNWYLMWVIFTFMGKIKEEAKPKFFCGECGEAREMTQKS